ncbi:hypothetical protein [Rhodococcus erythropolis]|uniref:Uncharacterized protein n=1 Tax=Rhodococcus erythropolis TaxID=1833 RepID=A0AAX4A067_RHOER|nr:hypothetical protein [Rhodococcus erythropolis]WMN02057.1 hypothetical protein QIE55_30345 [Rhodococcus erythropolis]
MSEASPMSVQMIRSGSSARIASTLTGASNTCAVGSAGTHGSAASKLYAMTGRPIATAGSRSSRESMATTRFGVTGMS